MSDVVDLRTELLRRNVLFNTGMIEDEFGLRHQHLSRSVSDFAARAPRYACYFRRQSDGSYDMAEAGLFAWSHISTIRPSHVGTTLRARAVAAQERRT